MTTRKSSSRRSAANTHQRPRHKHPNMLAFTGVEDHAMITMLTLLVAKHVTVVAHSVTYNGLFAGTERSSPKQQLCLHLRYVRLSRTPAPPVVVHDLRGSVAKRVLIPLTCVTSVTAAMPHPAHARPDTAPAFATDAHIARPAAARPARELKRFDHFDSSRPVAPAARPATVDEQTFGDLATPAARARSWDQFQVNRDKFGVNATFDETQYTTKIDRSGANFEQREREAQRMADEIENTESSNIHLREERNQQLASDFDEESRFSAVQRPSAPHPSKPAPQPRRSYLAAVSGTTEHPQPPKPSSAVNKNVSNGKHPSNGASKVAANTNLNNSQSGSSGSNINNTNKSAAANDAKAVPTVAKQHTVPNAKQHAAPNAKQHAASINKQHAAPNAKQHAPPKHSNAASKFSSASQKSQLADKNKSANSSQWPTTTTTTTATSVASSATSAGKGKTQGPLPKSSAQNAKSASAFKTASPTVSSAPAHGKESAPPARAAASKAVPPATASADKDKERNAASEKHTKASATRERSGSIPQFIKNRNYITGRNSPNQSRHSPMPTSAVADTSAVGVLNLHAQTPNLGPEQIKEFEEYKTNREFKSIAANREKITDDLKKFSTQLGSRNGAIRRAHSSSSQTISRVSSNVSTSSTSNAPNPSPEKSAVTNVTSHSAVTSDKNNNNLVTVDKKQQNKDPVADKKKRNERPQDSGASKTVEYQKSTDEPKQKAKPKFKLNPNAQEFKFNPDAPAFEPTAPKLAPQPSPAQPPTMMASYPPGAAPPNFSQPLPQPPQGYAVTMQPMPHMPYGAQPYVVMSPGVHAPIPGSAPMGYPYIQGNQMAFPPGPVPGRYTPSPGVPVSYGGVYPPVAPIVMAQGPQRVPSSAYYYNPGPYPGGQGGNPNMPHHPGQHMFAQHQMGPGQMQAAMGGGPRAPHGNHRRGGPGKGRGKQYGHSHGHANTNTIDRQSPTSPHGATTSDTGTR